MIKLERDASKREKWKFQAWHSRPEPHSGASNIVQALTAAGGRLRRTDHIHQQHSRDQHMRGAREDQDINPRQLITEQHCGPGKWRGWVSPCPGRRRNTGRTARPQEPDVSGRRRQSPDAANRCPPAKLHQPAMPTPNATYST